MTLDEAGRLYIAHNGVGRIEVFDAAGHLLTQYAAGNLLASNVAFGGPSWCCTSPDHPERSRGQARCFGFTLASGGAAAWPCRRRDTHSIGNNLERRPPVCSWPAIATSP